MKKKIALILMSLSAIAVSNVMAQEYTELSINLAPNSNYALKITPGAHTRVDETATDIIDVSNHNYAHRADATLSVIDLNNRGKAICTYGVSLMSGDEALNQADPHHNVLHEENNTNDQCLAAGDNGQYSPGTVSTGTNYNGQSHINLKVVPVNTSL